MEADPNDAQRLVSGPAIDQLEPMRTPPEIVPVMADWVGRATVCTPGGMALVGATEGWTFRRGGWSKQRSSMSDGVLNEEGGVGRQVAGDRVYQLPSATLRFDPETGWRTTANDPVPVAVGDVELAYHRPPSASARTSSSSDH